VEYLEDRCVPSGTTISTDITTSTEWTTAGSPYMITANVAVANGVTLTVDSGVTVQINNGVTITDNGMLNVTGAAGVGIEDNGNGGTEGIAVNGTMNVTGTAFTRTGTDYGGSFIQVNSNGELIASNSTFAWDQLSLANASILKSTDLSGNIFNLPIFLPATDVPLLSNNLSFEAVNLLAGNLTSGQSLARQRLAQGAHEVVAVPVDRVGP